MDDWNVNLLVNALHEFYTFRAWNWSHWWASWPIHADQEAQKKPKAQLDAYFRAHLHCQSFHKQLKDQVSVIIIWSSRGWTFLGEGCIFHYVGELLCCHRALEMGAEDISFIRCAYAMMLLPREMKCTVQCLLRWVLNGGMKKGRCRHLIGHNNQ